MKYDIGDILLRLKDNVKLVITNKRGLDGRMLDLYDGSTICVCSYCIDSTKEQYTKIEGEDNMSKLDRIQEMEKQLQLLSEEVEQEEKEQQPLVDSFGRYLTGPKDGTRYYVLNSFGEILVSNWKASDSDKKRLSKLSCFISKEKAQQYVEYTQAEMRILNRVAELNDGWEPTYTGVNNRTVDKKIYITYNSKGKNFEWLYVLWTICAPFYLKTGELAQQLISEMEDDLKIYFRVEDK